MAVTGKEVFDRALVLMDEVLETGAITTETPNYYKAKAVNILNILQTELLPITTTIVPLTTLDENVQVSDRIAYLVLPYGLAAHLLIVDDINIASFWNARYEELKRKVPITEIQTIDDVYGVKEVTD